MHQYNHNSVVLISSRSRLPVALGAAVGAAVAGLVLTAGQAKALETNVFVDGQSYNVTTFVGSYNNDPSKFTLTDMPWWNSSTLAGQFASAVGISLGTANNGGLWGPFFVYEHVSQWDYLRQRFVIGSSLNFSTPSPSTVATYATLATVASSSTTSPSSSVPGPLPALGLAVAFGFSRQLRKRIKASARNPPSTSEA